MTNYVLESVIFNKMQYSSLRKWLKNLSRVIVLALGVILGTMFYYTLPKIAGLVGTVFGTVVVFVFPALLHNKLLAKTSYDRCINYSLLIYGIILASVIFTLLVVTWNKQTHH